MKCFCFILAIVKLSASAPVKAPENVFGGGGTEGTLTITWDVSSGGLISPGSKITKLRLETSLKSQASDWLEWPVAISASQILEI
jgi:hypothetical protein